MNQARKLVNESEQSGCSFASGTVILADELIGGKGRFQRIWHAPLGGIWMTVVLVNTFVPAISRLLPLAAGVAACETVRQFAIPARLKWVNDVQVHGKKVAGILVESFIGSKSGEEYILIGLGLNVNNSDFPAELSSLACSMKEVGGASYNQQQVITDLLAKLRWNIGLLAYQEEQQLAGMEECTLLQDQWRKLSDCVGKQVAYGHDVQQDHQYEAQILGLDDDGGLRMKLTEDGVVITEYGGEIVYL